MKTLALHQVSHVAAVVTIGLGTGCFVDETTPVGAPTQDTVDLASDGEDATTEAVVADGERSTGSDGSSSTTDDSATDDSAADDDGMPPPPPQPPPNGCRSDAECDVGEYCASQCVAISCGDARVHADEQCDDGNARDGDGCDSDCTHTEVTIDVSWHNTCALLEGGRVRCWGDGQDGRLGYGNSETVGDDELPWQVGDVALPVPLDHLSSGDKFACGLSGTDVFCWGDGSEGALGSGDIDNLGDDELLVAIPAVPIGETVTRLTVGGSHSCASGPSGQLRCWGHGAAIGYGTGAVIGDDESPEMAGTVSVGAAIADVSAGIMATCVVQTDGAVRCWGDNESGQLGLGHTDAIGDDEVPSSVPALVFEEEAAEVSAGWRHTCARFVGGNVRCWGDNAYGQLGRGDEITQGDDELVVGLLPIALGDVGSVTHLAAGDHHTCALLDDGNVKCWGRNSFGQLGNGGFDHVGDDELPAISMVVELPAPVIQMDAGGNHTCAVLTDYRVYCWGRNGDGQLGLGHNQDIAVPSLAGPVAVLDPPAGSPQ